MHIAKFLTALALGTLLSSTAQAGSLEALRSFVAQFQSAQGDFSQRVESTNQHVTQSSGSFVFSRPGRFRWSYSKPYEQLIIADGQKLTQFDRDLNQVTVKKITDALGATPAAILFGEGNLDKTFDLTDDGSHDGFDWVRAVPKSKDTSFVQVRIGFRNGELAAMDLDDALGQKTHLVFSNLQRNVPIGPDTFKFVAPAGADVLQN